jgi:hypothetical protein
MAKGVTVMTDDLKNLFIRIRPETYDLIAEYSRKNRSSMAAFVDQTMLNELKRIRDEEDRIESATRNAGAIS